MIKIWIWMFLALTFLALPLLVFAQAGTLPAQLDWSNPNTTDTLQLEKSSALTGTYSTLNVLTPNTKTYLDATNNPGSTSCYRLAYKSTSGIGPYAGPVCKTFPAIPSETPQTFTVK